MGLLDNLQDPNFLYPLVAQLMQARKGQEMQALGQGLLGGVVGQQRGALNASQIASEEQQRQMHALTMDQMKRQGESASLLDSIAKRNYTPGMPQMQPTDYETPSGPAGPGSFNVKGYMSELPQAGSAGVSQMLALQQAMQKDSPFGKVDADKFTPESLRAFMQSGGHDFSLLQPRTKVELNGGVAYDPFGTKPGSVVLGPTSDVVGDGKGGFQYNPAKINPLEKQRVGIEGARLGIEGAKFNYDTGMPIPGGGFVTPGGLPPIPRQGQNAPQLPQGAPRTIPGSGPVAATVPGLSPKQQREVSAENAKSLPDDLKTYQDASANLDMLAAKSKQLREHPGLAGTTGGLSVFPNAPGSNASDAAAVLESLKAKTAFDALQAMRNASKTGGALGSVSDAEGKRLENSISALEKSQSTKQFKAELTKLELYAQNAKNRMSMAMRQKYGDSVFQQQADPLGIR